MKKFILFNFFFTILVVIPTESARNSFNCYMTTQGSGASVGEPTLATYGSCTTACYRLTSTLSMENINAVLNRTATKAVSPSFLSFISGDKGCLPLISGSSSIAQTTSVPLIINPVDVKSADVVTCYAKASPCDSVTYFLGGINYISLYSCANKAAIKNNNSCHVSGKPSQNKIAQQNAQTQRGAAGLVSSGPTNSGSDNTPGNVACSNTAKAGTEAAINVAVDMAAIVSLFCVSYGTCCITAVGNAIPCNTDPSIKMETTTKSSGILVKLNFILILILLCFIFSRINHF